MNQKPTVIFTAGAGGSGKSRVLANLYPDLPGVDSDSIKQAMPGYDPKHPEVLHKESSEAAMRLFYRHLSYQSDFYFDGTGKNVEKYATLFAAARSAGFRVKMLYVRASLATCIARNAKRARTVPVDAITEAHNSLAYAQAILKECVDEYQVIDND